MARSYVEDFENGAGGWIGWHSNARGAQPLAVEKGAAISRGPWWIDYNHAPPGGGYLHLLFALYTRLNAEQYEAIGGPNRFVRGGFRTNFTNAKLTARLRGELEPRSAELVLLAQAKVGDVFVDYVLSGQPFAVTQAWSEQTITLTPDPEQWTGLGARHDRTSFYGWGEIAEVLIDLNTNIIFVLFPLDVVPAEPVEGDPHRLKAGEDYRVDSSRLPQGYVMLDRVRIDFSDD
jgi:hypothetical protein